MNEPTAAFAPPPGLTAGTNPFSARAVLALVLFGAAAFVALLWMIGAGMTAPSVNDGGAHAGSSGLTGFSGMAEFAQRRGFDVRLSRSQGTLDDPGLLVLTPPAQTDGAELDRIVGARHRVGPTLVILPKWLAAPLPEGTPKARKGWVALSGIAQPSWPGFRDDIAISMGGKGARTARWLGNGLSGRLPDPARVQSGSGPRLVPLVRGEGGRVLAGYLDDGGLYPALEDLALTGPVTDADNERVYPLILVFEPDLLDNYGLADANNAFLAERLLRAGARSASPSPTAGARTVNFDLTLNGHARSANLLTLAFTPPFLAATLCLLMAALVAGWRAFMRFGPPRVQPRALAFGKAALVANSAGLVRRTRRYHLIAPPYLAAARDRLGAALALPHAQDADTAEAAIDRALAARAPQAEPFSAIARRLRTARKAPEILKAAQSLHALERILIR